MQKNQFDCWRLKVSPKLNSHQVGLSSVVGDELQQKNLFNLISLSIHSALPLPYHHHYLLFSCLQRQINRKQMEIYLRLFESTPLVMFNWLIPGTEADRQIDSGWDY